MKPHFRVATPAGLEPDVFETLGMAASYAHRFARAIVTRDCDGDGCEGDLVGDPPRYVACHSADCSTQLEEDE